MRRRITVTNKPPAYPPSHRHDEHCGCGHEHDKNCACGHDHGHAALHQHEHGTPEQASVLAARRAFASAAPVARDALEAAAVTMLRAVGDACCIDGILPGHAKALVECAEGALSLSLTVADMVDTQALGRWAELTCIGAFTVTVNINLLCGKSVEEEALFKPFAAL